MFTVWNHAAAAQPFLLSSSPFRSGSSPSLHRKVVLVSLPDWFSFCSVISTCERKIVRQDCIKEEVRESLTSGTHLPEEGVKELNADWYRSSQTSLWRYSVRQKSLEHKSAQWSKCLRGWLVLQCVPLWGREIRLPAYKCSSSSQGPGSCLGLSPYSTWSARRFARCLTGTCFCSGRVEVSKLLYWKVPKPWRKVYQLELHW